MSWRLRSLSTLTSNDSKILRSYFSEMRFPVTKPVPGQLLFIIYLVLRKEIFLDRCLGVVPFPNITGNPLLWYNKHKSHTTMPPDVSDRSIYNFYPLISLSCSKLFNDSLGALHGAAQTP